MCRRTGGCTQVSVYTWALLATLTGHKHVLHCSCACAQIVADAFAATLTRASLRRLHGLEWLNDEVINMYMQVTADSHTCLMH
jgi:Ulp1 family protease